MDMDSHNWQKKSIQEEEQDASLQFGRLCWLVEKEHPQHKKKWKVEQNKLVFMKAGRRDNHDGKDVFCKMLGTKKLAVQLIIKLQEEVRDRDSTRSA